LPRPINRSTCGLSPSKLAVAALSVSILAAVASA
jgi:hypothetical protein